MPKDIKKTKDIKSFMADAKKGADFTKKVLVDYSHEHIIADRIPKDNEGQEGDIYPLKLKTGRFLAVKYPDGWWLIGGAFQVNEDA